MTTSSKLVLLTIKSNFKPNLVSTLGEGGQAKVFKAKFHGKDVAIKYIPLDKVKDSYEYKHSNYGCDEYFTQEKFWELQKLKFSQTLSQVSYLYRLYCEVIL